MIGRIWHWFTDAHRHEWETIKEQSYAIWSMPDCGEEKVKTGDGIVYTLRCKSCGDITSRKVGI